MLEKQRQLADIYIPEVDLSLDSEEIEAAWVNHVQQKIIFRELINADADSEEMLEALEVFIGTSNMDGYLLDIEPQLENFWNDRAISIQ